jgi:hypothetical protein
LVVAAVAVIREDVLPAVVGVPVTAAPTIVNPVGNELAVYVIDLAAALVANKSTLAADDVVKLVVELFAVDQVTASC